MSDEFLRITPSGEIYLKSPQTKARFIERLRANLSEAVKHRGLVGEVSSAGHHELRLEGVGLDDLADPASRTFGVSRIERVREVALRDLEDLSRQVAALNRDRVAGRRFAVRVRRSGSHTWRSADAERRIGTLLLDVSSGVDLGAPEVTVRVYVRGEQALIVRETWEGPHGLPIGTQDRALVLLSGGIDSPVAGWMMLRRGCPIDVLHVQLDCAQADHALAVAYALAETWGHGAEVQCHVLDFSMIERVLRTEVRPGLRQVLLKALMTQAASVLGLRLHIPMLVTGDALGQVSSQTSAHLVAVDRVTELPILRPLVAMTKDEIVGWARRIGTFDLSVRGKEVCDLSGGKPVATAISPQRLQGALAALNPRLVEEAIATWVAIPARDWHPGVAVRPAL